MSEDGSFAEIGPLLSIGMNQTGTQEFGGSTASGSLDDMLSTTNYAIAFGFGQYIAGGNLVGLSLGFRFAYTLNDVVNEAYRSESGSILYNPNYTSTEKFEYKASHPFYLGVNLELNFDLGHMVSASCGKKTKFVLFQ